MATTMADAQDDLTLDTGAYKGPGRERTQEELEQLAYRDESLKKWEQSVLGAATADPNLPNVQVLKLVLQFENHPAIEIDPSKPDQSDTPVTIKEGSTFTSSLVFKVNHKVVPGLHYVQNVKRGPLRVSKDAQMLGSYGPSLDVYTNKFATEDAPTGMMARGTYVVVSRVADDDKNAHAEFKWAFKLAKDW